MKLTITNLLLVALAFVILGTVVRVGMKSWEFKVAKQKIPRLSGGSILTHSPGKKRMLGEEEESITGILPRQHTRTDRLDPVEAENAREADIALITEPSELANATVSPDDQAFDGLAEPIAEPVTEFVALPFGALGQVGTRQEDLVVLTTELPEALFEGTKERLNLANLEPVENKQEPLLVPPGLANLARGKRVTGSDDLPVIGDFAYITDGNKEAADGNYVEFGPHKQWVQIDLENPHRLYGIWLWHFHKSPRAYVDVIVQASNDKNFSDGSEVTVYNADHDNSSGLGAGADKAYVDTYRGRLIDAKGYTARYVRLYSNGNTANEMSHYIEVEVWGEDATGGLGGL